MPLLRPTPDTIDRSGAYSRVLAHHLLSVSSIVLGLLSLVLGFAVVQMADWPLWWVAGVAVPLVLLAQWSAWKAKHDNLVPFLESGPNDVVLSVPEYHQDYTGDVSGGWQSCQSASTTTARTPQTSMHGPSGSVHRSRSDLMGHGWYDAGWVESAGPRATIPSGSYRDLYVAAVRVAPSNRPVLLVRSLDPWTFHLHGKAMDDGHPIRVEIHQVGCDDPCGATDFAVEIRERAYLVGADAGL